MNSPAAGVQLPVPDCQCRAWPAGDQRSGQLVHQPSGDPAVDSGAYEGLCV